MAQTLNGVTTYYVGNDEEVTGATLLKYYHIPGLPVLGTITGVTRTYLVSDGLGSETVDLSYNGSVLATALYGPYGVGRYATGTMPTSKGYTGQRQDSGSGLDYYGARYYDATAGQFTSADTLQGPNRYAYVGGNPTTRVDPSGHMNIERDDEEGGGPPGGSGSASSFTGASGPPAAYDNLRNLYFLLRGYFGIADGTSVNVTIPIGPKGQGVLISLNGAGLTVAFDNQDGSQMQVDESNTPQTDLWIQVLEDHLQDDPATNRSAGRASAFTRANYLASAFGGTITQTQNKLGYNLDIDYPGQPGFQIRVADQGPYDPAAGPYFRIMLGHASKKNPKQDQYLDFWGRSLDNRAANNGLTHFYVGDTGGYMGDSSSDLLLQNAIIQTAINDYESGYGLTFPSP